MTKNTHAIMESLAQNSIIDTTDLSKIKTHVERCSSLHEPPILLRLFFWIGAFLSGIFLLLFLMHNDPLKNMNDLTKFTMSVVVFIPCAIFLERVALRRKQNIGTIALLQLSIALLWVGKYYFCSIFFFHMGNNTLASSMAPMLVTALVYPFFRQELDRFLSPLFSLMYLFVSTITIFTEPILHDYAVNLILLGEMCALIAIFFHPKTKYMFIPLAYAIAISLIAQATFHHFFSGSLHSKFLGSVIMGAGLLTSISLINREKKKLTLEQGTLIIVAIALLVYFNVSQILLSLFIVTIGYARREALLFWAGLTFLPLFIIIYYHGVEMTLLAKSLSLMGTGFVLLAGKFYMDHRVINQSRHS